MSRNPLLERELSTDSTGLSTLCRQFGQKLHENKHKRDLRQDLGLVPLDEDPLDFRWAQDRFVTGKSCKFSWYTRSPRDVMRLIELSLWICLRS